MYLIAKNNNLTKLSHPSYLAKPEKCQGHKFVAFNMHWVSLIKRGID